ncbi:MAG: hypothetical protein QOF76_1465 [Solirubrobacteraceae bacterium]|nr:hypothetical protein [Solirubrobacteraceae bacterium]
MVRNGSAQRREVEDAFGAFEATLREHLTAEARRAVEQALVKLARSPGPFRAIGADVEVKLKALKLEATPAKRSRATRRPGTSPGRGRPPGALRNALLDAFSDPTATKHVEELRDHVEGNGLTITTDNLHQHLRRLVLAGELERAGRGVYKRAG